MTEENFNRDVYLATDMDGLSRLADLLSVKSDFVYVDEQPEDDSRFVRKENFLIATTIQGDFRYIAEIFIWSAQENDMLSIFESASTYGIAIVVEDTSDDASPMDEILFCEGQRFSAEVGEDDTFGEVFLTKPSALRKTLVRLSGSAEPEV